MPFRYLLFVSILAYGAAKRAGVGMDFDLSGRSEQWRKKLQDFFVDAKIDRFAREIAPVVIDAAGQIVWVAGHALAEEFKVTEATKDVVILKRLPI